RAVRRAHCRVLVLVQLELAVPGARRLAGALGPRVEGDATEDDRLERLGPRPESRTSTGTDLDARGVPEARLGTDERVVRPAHEDVHRDALRVGSQSRSQDLSHRDAAEVHRRAAAQRPEAPRAEDEALALAGRRKYRRLLESLEALGAVPL